MSASRVGPDPVSGGGPIAPGSGALEPERYELREVLLDDGVGTPSRREFLRVLGGGLVVAFIARDAFAAPPDIARALAVDAGGQDAVPEEISAWLHIDAKGAVTVYTGKVEVGQGIRTSLAQELAEELRVPLASVTMVMGDTDLTPYDMGTFGSRSTPQMGEQLRKVGATARERLIGLAAERWKVDGATLTAADGRVSDAKGGRSLAYGALTAGRPLTETVRGDAALTPADRWTVAGAAASRVGARDIVTGKHRYTPDVRLPGMLRAKILRAPTMGATLASVDLAAARAMPGVTVVREGDFVGVAAPDEPTAERALAAITATWTPTGEPQPSSDGIFDYLRKTPPRARADGQGEGGFGGRPFVQGDADAALAAAAHRIDRTYTVAYIAHVPLEPRAAVAEWTRDAAGDKLTVWTGTQRPFAVREELARGCNVPRERVRVIVPDTGSGYGGKHTGEVALEASRLAKASGHPVKLVWTREEEFRWAYFRPAGVIDVKAGATADGTMTGWTHDNWNSGGAGIRPLYAIANQRVAFHPSESPLRQGSYRALAATANTFAREMAIDELAHVAGMDPLAFRLKNLTDPRLKAVFQTAAGRFGWRSGVANAATTSAGGSARGQGIAGGFEKGGYVATCAEVDVDRATGAVRIVRVVTAFDCGAIVNPDGLKNQLAGAMIQGIGGALFEAIEFEHGAVRNARLSQYRVPRFSDIPAIEIALIDRKEEPSFGAGESPIMGLAPAVGAAIFDATGSRPHSLPMARGGLRIAEVGEKND